MTVRDCRGERTSAVGNAGPRCGERTKDGGRMRVRRWGRVAVLVALGLAALALTGTAGARQVGGDLAARKLVVEHDAHPRRHAQLHQLQVGLGEVAARLFVEDDGVFEGGTGEPVFDAHDGVPQVEQARGALSLLQQAEQAVHIRV